MSEGGNLENNPERQYADIEDIDLLQKAFKGNAAAWREFYRRYNPIVWMSVRQHDVPPNMADEVTQDIWLSLVEDDFRRLRAWDTQRSRLSAYFNVVVRNLIVDYLRSRKHTDLRRRIFLEDFLSEEDSGEMGLENILHQHSHLPEQERLRHLETSVEEILNELVESQEISEREHLLLLLRLNGCTAKEIDEHVGLGVVRVENLLRRARVRVLESLKRRHINGMDDLIK